jgi:hypothetical protein
MNVEYFKQMVETRSIAHTNEVLRLFKNGRDAARGLGRPVSPGTAVAILSLPDEERIRLAEKLDGDIKEIEAHLYARRRSRKSREPSLSAAELRYCEAEDIKPMDFLKVKSRRNK